MNEGDDDPVTEGLSEFVDDALNYKPEVDSGGTRDAAWLRWLKFVSLIVGPALVFGLGFLFEDYLRQYTAQTYYQRERAERRVQRDSMESMKFRFVIGACVGGGLGMIYVVRCVARKVDP